MTITNCKILLFSIICILIILLCCDIVMKEQFVASFIHPTTGYIDTKLHTTSVHNRQITVPPIIQLVSVVKNKSIEPSKYPAIGIS